MSGTPLITIVTASRGEGASGSVRKFPVAVLYKRKHFVFSFALIALTRGGSTLVPLPQDGRGGRLKASRPPALSVGPDMLNSDDEIEFVVGHLLVNLD